MKHLILLLSAILAGLSGAASASEALVEDGKAEALSIPFEPPTDTPMNYSVVIEKKRPRGDTSLEFEQKLTFREVAEGYLLHLNVLAITIGGLRVDLTDQSVLNHIPTPIRPFVMSVEVELDQFGEPVRLRDWEKIRASLSELPTMIADELDPDERERAIAASEMILRPLVSSSAEKAPALIIKGWPAILGYGGMELDDGDLYEADTLVDGGLLPNALEAVAQLSLERNDEGDLHFRQSVAVDPDALLSGVNTVLELLRTTDASAIERDDDTAGSNPDRIEMVDDLDVVFDKQTGMPVRAVMTRLLKVNGNEVGGEVISVNRVGR